MRRVLRIKLPEILVAAVVAIAVELLLSTRSGDGMNVTEMSARMRGH